VLVDTNVLSSIESGARRSPVTSRRRTSIVT
jgi:hypothetical protein